jgi:hypothetical protein
VIEQKMCACGVPYFQEKMWHRFVFPVNHLCRFHECGVCTEANFLILVTETEQYVEWVRNGRKGTWGGKG